MTGKTGLAALFLVLLLILPVSSLVTRRIPIGQAAKMALAWLAIFAVVLIVIAGRHRLTTGWSRVTTMVAGSDQSVVGGNVRIRKSDDGHFWANAKVDGVKRLMLIDSGATTTALSAATARAANLNLTESPFATILSTANGSIAAQRSTIASLEIGTITAHDLPVVVSPSFGDTDVLGMNFLSHLKGWRVEGDVLVLQPNVSSN